MIKNNAGILSVDFLFSFTLAILLSMMLLAVSATYWGVEIAQYIAYSASRAHAAADVSVKDQKDRGLAKLDELIKTNRVFQPLFGEKLPNAWFSLKLKDMKSGGHSSAGGDPSENYDSDYTPEKFQPTGGIPQVGLRLAFVAKVLRLKVGILGSTDDNEGAGYKATITGLMNREPTQQECEDLMTEQKRYQNILNLDPRFKDLVTRSGAASGKFFPLEDNGC
ncbi:MAG: hypothetical protein JNM39_01475 [Bdellovibrionaceae bacterium]|nr:hypothetical protein [Pseudobdellovibrionaceae bacterium]